MIGNAQVKAGIIKDKTITVNASTRPISSTILTLLNKYPRSNSINMSKRIARINDVDSPTIIEKTRGTMCARPRKYNIVLR